jgi:hypothetical protein
MYKTGIWHLVPARQLQNPRTRDVTSYRLLNEVAADKGAGHPEADEIFESIVRHLRLSSGIFRSTYRQRFADLDPVVNAILHEAFRGSNLEVQDWAASDCLASAEWASALWATFPSARVIASDALLCLTEVSRPDGKEAYVLEPDGTPLQYIRPPFVVSLQKPIPPYYPVNRLLASRAKRGLAEAQEASRLHQSSQKLHSQWKVGEINLIHPLARRIAAQDSRFEARNHSVFAALPSPCNAIRTMNIFNRGYFDEARLRQGASCVLDSLVEGGIWIVGRTREEMRPPRNSVSIFQKVGQKAGQPGAFKLWRRLNDGSEIEPLILSEAREPDGVPIRAAQE